MEEKHGAMTEPQMYKIGLKKYFSMGALFEKKNKQTWESIGSNIKNTESAVKVDY